MKQTTKDAIFNLSVLATVFFVCGFSGSLVVQDINEKTKKSILADKKKFEDCKNPVFMETIARDTFSSYRYKCDGDYTIVVGIPPK